ncbi:MAG: flavodoxin-dependent (E)-4-hydroxy-3-methylbut-2-enyl-diphosphate synthase, partial [Actinobacteria bacterium]|nr:flavodoxin-dependent (E)-4-hydroxy-3-methylbut-2-enyl-diphosphate synthase [Actinomycetota bacterium]
MQIKRKITSEITVGKIRIGAGNPVIVQSMLKSRSDDIASIRAEIKELEENGCEIIRQAIPDMPALDVFKTLLAEKTYNVPVIADIHFDTDLAVKALECGADCVRVNPGNMGGLDRLEKIVKKAKEKNAAIRIGVNFGSIDKKMLKLNSGNRINAMVQSALEIADFFEKLKFFNFKISAKVSSVLDTISVYRIISSKTDYPLHLGITEAGLQFTGIIKSAVGMGVLLSEGIGDTIRVSLTDASVNEVKAAYAILSSLGLRKYGIEIISCPTCGRTMVDLKEITSDVAKITKNI